MHISQKKKKIVYPKIGYDISESTILKSHLKKYDYIQFKCVHHPPNIKDYYFLIVEIYFYLRTGVTDR